VEVNLEDLPRSSARSWSCPDKAAGRRTLPVERSKYSNIRRTGPESLRHFKRTFRESLKRQIASGLYDPANPVIVPIREDRRYRSWHLREVPESNAVIIFCMDVSGSMGDQQKEIVRIASFWIDTWLRSQYKSLDNVYVVHEAFAREVDQHTFYHLRESGGTRISTPTRWSIRSSTPAFPRRLERLPVPLLGRGEQRQQGHRPVPGAAPPRAPGQAEPLLLRPGPLLLRRRRFKADLEEAFPGEARIITSDIRDRDEIYDAIKRFLGKGL